MLVLHINGWLHLDAVCMFVVLHLSGKMELFDSLSNDIFCKFCQSGKDNELIKA